VWECVKDEVYEKKDRTIKMQWTQLNCKLFNEVIKIEYERQRNNR